MQNMEQQRKWIEELRRAHAAISWQYRVGLSCPALELSAGTRIVGRWDKFGRTIRVSTGIIERCSWDVVLQVFKHEMAHQYVDEVLGQHDDPPHGQAFQFACERLGVLLFFRKANGLIPEFLSRLEINSPTEQSRLLTKVEKLLSLANSTNEHEAALAMEKANDLLRKYNLERLDQVYPDNYVRVIINEEPKRLDAQRRRIATLLLNYFFVKVVYSTLFDARTCETYQTVELLGTKENVMIAEYVYHFLVRQVNRLWQNYHEATGVSHRQRLSYVLGVLAGLEERLRQAEARAQGRSEVPVSALVRAKDQGLRAFTALLFPRLYTAKRKGLSLFRETFTAGTFEGRRLTINKPISKTDGYLGRLLESDP